MTFTKVERLPEKRRPKKSLKYVFEEFLNMNVEVAKVDFNEREYKSPSVAYCVLRAGAKRHGAPIKVYLRNDEIYFERRD